MQVRTAHPPDGGLQARQVRVRQLLDGGDAPRGEGLLGLLPDAPEGADGQRVQEVHRGLDGHEHQPVGLGVRRGQLGHELVPRDAHRRRHAVLGLDATAQRGPDHRGRAEPPSGTAHVEERLVHADLLDERGDLLEHAHDRPGHLVVQVVVGLDHGGLRTQQTGPRHRHGGPHTERAGLVGRRQHDPAVLAADDHRQTRAAPAAGPARRTRRTRPCPGAAPSSRTRPIPSRVSLPLTAAPCSRTCSVLAVAQCSVCRPAGHASPRPRAAPATTPRAPGSGAASRTLPAGPRASPPRPGSPPRTRAARPPARARPAPGGPRRPQPAGAPPPRSSPDQAASSGSACASMSHTVRAPERADGRPRSATTAAAERIAARCACTNRSPGSAERAASASSASALRSRALTPGGTARGTSIRADTTSRAP